MGASAWTGWTDPLGCSRRLRSHVSTLDGVRADNGGHTGQGEEACPPTMHGVGRPRTTASGEVGARWGHRPSPGMVPREGVHHAAVVRAQAQTCDKVVFRRLRM